jgi:hypothetical protein
MNSLKTILINSLSVMIVLGQISCHHSDPAVPPAAPQSNVGSVILGPNVMAIKMAPTGICNVVYSNAPCTSVTICTPGTNTCQTISDILVDTGSYGLRIFSSAINGVNLTQITDGSPANNPVAECAQFGSGSTWGPVMTARVELASENPIEIPMQVINSSYNKVPSACPSLETSPSTSGFNGILGVGLFTQDCGAGCATSATNGVYFSCTASGCTSTKMPLANQVINPVVALTPLSSGVPADNNGVLVVMPAVPALGATTVVGSLVFGIGTQSNNTPPSGVVPYGADNSGNFTTVFNGITYTNAAFVDSGSNGFFFPPPSGLTVCANGTFDAGFFCPSFSNQFTATMTGITPNKSSVDISFTINNATTLFNTNNIAFNNLGGDVSGIFDWGIDFFYGRSVYVGVQGGTSYPKFGPGPYWAF